MVKRRGIRQGIVLLTLFGGLLLLSVGCVTQDWVRNTIQETDKPLADDVARLKSDAAAQKARVDQLASQLSATRSVADEAARTANEAKQQAGAAAAAAQQANQKAEAVDGRLTRALADRLKRNQVQQVSVTFKSGRADLSREAQSALQGVPKLLADHPTYTADVVGHTDIVGGSDTNVDLSWYREEAVRRFLVENGVALNRLTFIGLGKDKAAGKDAAGKAKDRNVTVTVYAPAD